MVGLASFGTSTSLKAFLSATLKLGQSVSTWAARVRANSVITGMWSVLARCLSGSVVQQVMSLESWKYTKKFSGLVLNGHPQCMHSMHKVM